MREVKKHKTAQTGIWMTFEDGVYDVTEFSKRHVWGGGVFLQAAGGPIEPFWNLYPFHK
jgi:sulfite oxidase